MFNDLIDKIQIGLDRFRFDYLSPTTSTPRASLIFSRFFWENPAWENVGSGRMQKEAFKCLCSLGYTTSFAGQEDRWYPKHIWSSDIIVSLAPPFSKFPKKVPGITCLYTCNTHVVVKNRRLMEAEKVWNLQPENRVDSTIFLSAYEKADYLLIAENDQGIANFTSHGVSREKIYRYNNAVDSDVWVPSTEKRNKFTFVCWSSELGLRKGLPVLVKAWKRWYQGQDAELIIIGMPTRSTEIIFNNQKNGEVFPGLHIQLKFYPTWHKPLIDLIGSSHVAVLPTLEDAQPSSLLEMTSCGLAVITTHESGVNFDPDFCYYVHPNNVESLVNALEFWYQKRDEVADCGNIARRYILDNHSWKIFRDRFSAIIAEIMR